VLCEVKGVKIAFVAFTKGMDGMALPAGSDNCVNVLYKDYASAYQEVDTEGIAKIMENAAEANPDLTVALVHWGSEYNDNISKTQETIRDTLLENGADAIIGTHSHYVQKMELDPETGTFIAYSLGDFMGDTQRAGSEYSVILDLEITKNNRTGVTKIKSYDYHPIFTVNEKDKPMRVVRIESAMKAHEIGYIDAVNKETYAAMEYALKRIEARVKGE
jgi:poly-gamma-glutamate synthesis protein (capsule biosynthesis protein)